MPANASTDPVERVPSDRSQAPALVLGLLGGWIGAHRFYLRDFRTGLFQLIAACVALAFVPTGWFALAGLLVWSWIDLVQLLRGRMRDGAGHPLLFWRASKPALRSPAVYGSPFALQVARDRDARFRRADLVRAFLLLPLAIVVLPTGGPGGFQLARLASLLLFLKTVRGPHSILWLRRFGRRESRLVWFHKSLQYSARGWGVPITLQGRSFSASYRMAFSSSALAVPLLLVALVVGVRVRVDQMASTPQEYAPEVNSLVRSLEESRALLALVLCSIVLAIPLAAIGFRRRTQRVTAANCDRVLPELQLKIRDRRELLNGVLVLRCDDLVWEKTVSRLADEADAIVVDLSAISANVATELLVLRQRSVEGVVLIMPDDSEYEAEPLVRHLLGEEYAERCIWVGYESAAEGFSFSAWLQRSEARKGLREDLDVALTRSLAARRIEVACRKLEPALRAKLVRLVRDSLGPGDGCTEVSAEEAASIWKTDAASTAHALETMVTAGLLQRPSVHSSVLMHADLRRYVASRARSHGPTLEVPEKLDPAQIASTLRHVATAFSRRDDHESALSWFQRAAEVEAQR